MVPPNWATENSGADVWELTRGDSEARWFFFFNPLLVALTQWRIVKVFFASAEKKKGLSGLFFNQANRN